jgi:hypothetical protein
MVSLGACDQISLSIKVITLSGFHCNWRFGNEINFKIYLYRDVSFDAFRGLLDSLQHLVGLDHLLQESAGVLFEAAHLKLA